MTSTDGPELEVDAEHDEAGQEEGDAGGGDGVLRAEVEPAREVHHGRVVHHGGWRGGGGHVGVAEIISSFNDCLYRNSKTLEKFTPSSDMFINIHKASFPILL